MSGRRNVSISEPRELKEQRFGATMQAALNTISGEKSEEGKSRFKHSESARVSHEHPLYIHIRIHPNLKLNFPLHAESTGKKIQGRKAEGAFQRAFCFVLFLT